jgi:hypothetical protein
MPMQTPMDQLGKGYYLSKQGHGVENNLSWLAISQNQSFLGPWSQMPQPIATSSLVPEIHTRIPLATSSSHVGDWLITFASHVED